MKACHCPSSETPPQQQPDFERLLFPAAGPQRRPSPVRPTTPSSGERERGTGTRGPTAVQSEHIDRYRLVYYLLVAVFPPFFFSFVLFLRAQQWGRSEAFFPGFRSTRGGGGRGEEEEERRRLK